MATIPGEYKLRTAEHAEVTLVDTHRGEFLVITAGLPLLKTLVLQRHHSQLVWIHRRTVAGRMDPAAAVSGHLLSTFKEIDVFEELEKRLHARDAAYWKLLNENLTLKAAPKKNGRKISARRGRR